MDASQSGAIFDLDGTLIDTYEAHRAAWATACAAHGIDLTAEMFSWSFGRTNPSIIRRFWSDHGRDDPTDEEIDAVAERKESDFRSRLIRESPVMPGVPELFAALRADGFRIAIGTSAPRGNLELAVEILGIETLVDASVCGGEVTHGKPDPEVFVLAARRMGVPAARCVVMEDAGAGIDAARAGGMAAIGIVSTGRTHRELDHADLVVERFDSLRVDDFVRLLPRP